MAALEAVVSISHLKVKFHTEFGVGEILGDQEMSRQCYVEALTPKKKCQGESSVNHVIEVDPNEIIEIPKESAYSAHEATEDIPLDPTRPERSVKIGKGLPIKIKQDLVKLLQDHADIFAWDPKDMPGILEIVALHRLNIKPGVRPVRQKKRTFSHDKQEAIDIELDRLLEAGFITEVQFPKWIANTVLVKKSNGKWRMCVDYSDLNRACPKDFYPLPNIDQLIDATSGHELLSFMDAFAGYNQIKMAEEDRDDTAFITHRGVFAYRVVPFGLLNAGATFQKMMDTIFEPQIGRNMQIYVDDMIVKSLKAEDHINDLRETFGRIRQNQVRLNPAKCSFGLGGGKFLGFLLTQRGIEADPSQIKAIQEMPTPKTMKDLQVLTGCIAALRRFIPQSARRCLPMYEAIKATTKANRFEWTEDCARSLNELKNFLDKPPILSKAAPCEPLKLYLSASDMTIAAVLVKEEGTDQKPIYYISHTLKDAETRYTKIEKLIFALVIASRKLRQYFQGRQVTVMTNQPLRRILHRPDMSGRLAAWTIELSQFSLEFAPRMAMKSQALSDFVAECNFSDNQENKPSPNFTEKAWTLFTDGSSTSQSGGAGIILTSPEGFKVQQAIKFLFPVTNNEAEYEALIAGIKLALHLEVKVIEIFSDSQLVVKQVVGEFKTLNERMLAYMQLSTRLLQSFVSWTINNIDRSVNHWADALSKLATTSMGRGYEPIYIKELQGASTTEVNVNCVATEEDWRTPIKDFIEGTLVLEDKVELRKMAHKSQNYCLVEGKLYRRAMTEPLLRCVGPSEAETAMIEIHSGICGNHVAGKNMALKIIRHGVFWPTMRKDCEDFTRKCKPCQLYGAMNHRPSIPLNPTAPPCPFFMWGMDLVGPLPKSTGQRQYIIVAVDYSTKWVEAKALARIREAEVIQFFMEYIVFRFGVPRVVVTDNGTQFVGEDFENTLNQLKVKHIKASVAYPQANGQVEITNKAILQGIKKRLLEVKGNWTDELPNVLWGYRTTPRTSTGETPIQTGVWHRGSTTHGDKFRILQSRKIRPKKLRRRTPSERGSPRGNKGNSSPQGGPIPEKSGKIL